VSSPPPPSGFDELFELHLDMVLAAVSYNLPDEGLPPATVTHRGWLTRAEDRARARQAWARWFTDHDVLLCPVTAMPAFPHDQEGDIGTRTLTIDGEQRPHMTTVGWCGLFSVLGLPTVVMPTGFTSGGLPVGVQVVAPYLRDHTAVTFARLAAAVLDGSVAPPE
jgi:amidase